jgi:hypothetical protein
LAGFDIFVKNLFLNDMLDGTIRKVGRRFTSGSTSRLKKDGELALRLLPQSSSDNARLEWTVLAFCEALFEVAE